MQSADWSQLTSFEVLTQFSPSSTFVGQATDLSKISRSFTGILLAAGKLGPRREQAVQLSQALGLHVWLDVDMTSDYAKGVRLTSRLEDLAAFAQRHPKVVVGIKLANEIGQSPPYADDPALLEGYLRTVGSVLHAAAPGLPITVDMPMPESACAPGTPGLGKLGGAGGCRARVAARFPALLQKNVDHYLSLGVLDGVFMTPYLREDEVYASAGTDTADVLQSAYRWIADRPWAGQVKVFSRKALAFPNRSYPGTGADAELAVRRHLTVPMSEGLAGADIWAWHRAFRGELRTLLNKDESPNPLWDGLVQFRQKLLSQQPGRAAERTQPLPTGSAARA